MKRDHYSSHLNFLLAGSDGHDDMVVLDLDLVAFDDVRTFYPLITALHGDIEAADLEPARRATGLPRLDFNLPAMKRTAGEFALPRDGVFANALRPNQSDHRTLAQLRAAVRTTVQQGKESQLTLTQALAGPDWDY